jgi:hypothetical protein
VLCVVCQLPACLAGWLAGWLPGGFFDSSFLHGCWFYDPGSCLALSSCFAIEELMVSSFRSCLFDRHNLKKYKFFGGKNLKKNKKIIDSGSHAMLTA